MIKKKAVIFGIAAVVILAVAALCIYHPSGESDNSTSVTIRPFAVSFDADHPEDGIYPVSINNPTTMKETEHGYAIEFKFFNHDLYDAVELHLMKVGDSVMIDGTTYAVCDKGQDGEYITINGGIEKGGFNFQPIGGGAYQISGFSDHTTYSPLGIVSYEVSGDIAFIDAGSTDSVVISEDVFDYLLKHSYDSDYFNEHVTRIRIESGNVVEFWREYRP